MATIYRAYAPRILSLLLVHLMLSACSEMLSGHMTDDDKLRSESIPLGQFLIAPISSRNNFRSSFRIMYSVFFKTFLR